MAGLHLFIFRVGANTLNEIAIAARGMIAKFAREKNITGIDKVTFFGILVKNAGVIKIKYYLLFLHVLIIMRWQK